MLMICAKLSPPTEHERLYLCDQHFSRSTLACLGFLSLMVWTYGSSLVTTDNTIVTVNLTWFTAGTHSWCQFEATSSQRMIFQILKDRCQHVCQRKRSPCIQGGGGYHEKRPWWKAQSVLLTSCSMWQATFFLIESHSSPHECIVNLMCNMRLCDGGSIVETNWIFK